jgi:hypothetical protein
MIFMDLGSGLARLACLKDVQSNQHERTLVCLPIAANVHARHKANVNVEGEARSAGSGRSVRSGPVPLALASPTKPLKSVIREGSMPKAGRLT